MAKIGLNYGEKLQIADKTYRVISEGLDIPQVFGKLTFRGLKEQIPSMNLTVPNAILTAPTFRLIQEKFGVLW